MKGDEVRIRQQGTAAAPEPRADDWRWLAAVAGRFSSDFFAGGRNQPRLEPRPGLDRAFG